MKKLSLLIVACAASFVAIAQSCITVATECDSTNDYCGPYELCSGIYRIPFVTGTDIQITNDHLNHCPRGRIDMVATSGAINGEYHIAAAADGWIRAIVDGNTIQCDCNVSSCDNNYIWIEHANGEWSKYTHMKHNSVPASLSVNDFVTAGTYLGNEGDVGCASGVHLHFEIAQPVDTNTLVFSAIGGYIDGSWAKNVIPVFCDIGGHVFLDGTSYTAAACGTSSCSASIGNSIVSLVTGGHDVDIASSTVTNSATYDVGAYASALWQAGSSITLIPGFVAETYSTFTARIGACNAFPVKTTSEGAGPDESSGENTIEIFPNPADAEVTIRVNNTSRDPTALFITDIMGKVVSSIFSSQMISKEHSEYRLNTLEFSPGIYFCIYQSGEQMKVNKFVVQH